VRRQRDIFSAEPVRREDGRQTWRLYGSLFFGAVTKIDPIVAEVEAAPGPLHLLLDAHLMVSLDTTGLDALEQLHKALRRRGGRLEIVGLQPQPASLMARSGFAGRLAEATGDGQ